MIAPRTSLVKCFLGEIDYRRAVTVGTESLSEAKRRIIDRLKRVESATAPELAEAFGLTDTAVRQHLDALAEVGLVETVTGGPGLGAPPRGRGRPPTRWRLTPLADDLFPDRHSDLTVELIRSIREALGDDALAAVVGARAKAQTTTYRAALPDPAVASVKVRVRRLADLRTAEGYLAEAVSDGPAMLLIEHHCPVCEAATTCAQLCRAELELFRDVLGPALTVEREQHVLAGDRRCAYRISPR